MATLENRARQQKEKILEELEDVIIEDGKSHLDDVIVVVIGPHGSGKSTFINQLFNSEVRVVGDGQNGCTTRLKPHIKGLGIGVNRRFIVVDTPGFDGQSIEGVIDVLTHVYVWLEASYNNEKRVLGFIYIRDIADDPLHSGPSSRRYRTLFRKLAGDDAGSVTPIILGTTKWRKVEESVGKNHFEQLKSDFWSGYFRENSSSIFKFEDSHESALEIFNSLLQKFSRVDLSNLIVHFKYSTTINVTTSKTTGIGSLLEDLIHSGSSGLPNTFYNENFVSQIGPLLPVCPSGPAPPMIPVGPRSLLLSGRMPADADPVVKPQIFRPIRPIAPTSPGPPSAPLGVPAFELQAASVGGTVPTADEDIASFPTSETLDYNDTVMADSTSAERTENTRDDSETLHLDDRIDTRRRRRGKLVKYEQTKKNTERSTKTINEQTTTMITGQAKTTISGSFYKASGVTMNGASMVDGVAAGANVTIQNDVKIVKNIFVIGKDELDDFLKREGIEEKEIQIYKRSETRKMELAALTSYSE